VYSLDDLLDVIQGVLLLHQRIYVAVVPIDHQQIEVHPHPSNIIKITLGSPLALLFYPKTSFRF
jgi:hypothetical protein